MIKFGTSGFRGIIADTFTVENVEKVSQALSNYIIRNNCKKQVFIGYDRRFLSDYFAKAFAVVLCANGIKVNLVNKPVPSPSVAWNVKNLKLDFGVMVTASHNPYIYNGIKIFVKGGVDADESYTTPLAKESNLLKSKDIKKCTYEEELNSKLLVIENDINSYLNHLLKLVDVEKIKQSKFKILINTMHGVGGDYIDKLLSKIGVKNYDIINNEVDAKFGGILPAPSINTLKSTCELVKEKYDIGFALDGDADRISFIDKTGEIFDGNRLLPILYYYILEHKKMDSDVVQNTALSGLVLAIAKYYNKQCVQVKVGFKNIAKGFSNSTALIGGETNGLAYKPNVVNKDGVCISLLVLECVSTLKMTLGEILKKLQEKFNFKSEIVEYAYPITEQKKQEIFNKIFEKKLTPLINKKVESISLEDGMKITYEKGYWGTIRFSGNENVVRIFVEMEDKANCEKVLKIYEKFIGVSVRQI